MVLKGLDTTNVEIFNIIVGGWAHYNRDTDKMNGLTMQKIEQSKILGLRPVVVSKGMRSIWLIVVTSKHPITASIILKFYENSNEKSLQRIVALGNIN